MNLICFMPLIRELAFKYTIIIHQKINNGWRDIIDYGKEIKDKDGVRKIQFANLNYKEPIPKSECVTPQAANIPLRWLGGKTIHCTLIDNEITWTVPDIEFKKFTAVDSGEKKLAIKLIYEGVKRLQVQEEKEDPLKEWAPVICIFFICALFAGGMIWILNNGGADMYQSIIAGFNEGARTWQQINNSVMPIG